MCHTYYHEIDDDCGFVNIMQYQAGHGVLARKVSPLVSLGQRAVALAQRREIETRPANEIITIWHSTAM